jgi:hypothetical protein
MNESDDRDIGATASECNSDAMASISRRFDAMHQMTVVLKPLHHNLLLMQWLQ